MKKITWTFSVCSKTSEDIDPIPEQSPYANISNHLERNYRELQYTIIKTAMMFKRWKVRSDKIENMIKYFTWSPYRFHDHANPLKARVTKSWQADPSSFLIRTLDRFKVLDAFFFVSTEAIEYIIKESEKDNPRIDNYDEAQDIIDELRKGLFNIGYEYNSSAGWNKRSLK